MNNNRAQLPPPETHWSHPVTSTNEPTPKYQKESGRISLFPSLSLSLSPHLCSSTAANSKSVSPASSSRSGSSLHPASFCIWLVEIRTRIGCSVSIPRWAENSVSVDPLKLRNGNVARVWRLELLLDLKFLGQIKWALPCSCFPPGVNLISFGPLVDGNRCALAEFGRARFYILNVKAVTWQREENNYDKDDGFSLGYLKPRFGL